MAGLRPVQHVHGVKRMPAAQGLVEERLQGLPGQLGCDLLAGAINLDAKQTNELVRVSRWNVGYAHIIDRDVD